MVGIVFLFSVFFYGLMATAQRPSVPVNETNVRLLEDVRDKGVDRIAFGSCNKHDLPQTLWTAARALNPDLWIWMGDNVYGDTDNPNELAEKYLLQKLNPLYEAFTRRVPVIGTWDDHDYGKNNAGKDYPQKAISQQLLLDFLDVPLNSKQRKRAGVYHAHMFGRAPHQVKIILLDTRYFREQPSASGDLLGEAQWKWLKEELDQSKAQVNLIVSSIQVLDTSGWFSEKWSRFPRSRKRLLDLVQNSKAQRIVLMSGDIHHSELSLMRGLGRLDNLWEATASGMTHTRKPRFAKNPYALKESRYHEPNFGFFEFNWGQAGLEQLWFVQISAQGGEFARHRLY